MFTLKMWNSPREDDCTTGSFDSMPDALRYVARMIEANDRFVRVQIWEYHHSKQILQTSIFMH